MSIPLLAWLGLQAHAATITLTLATPDRASVSTTWQEYTIPKSCRWVQLYLPTTAGKLAWTGTDGGSPGTDYLPVPADTWMEWRIPGSGYGSEMKLSANTTIYVAIDTGSQTITVQCTQDGT